MSYYIEPLPEDFPLSLAQMCDASEVAKRDPLRLTDFQLQILACYDRDAAQMGSKRRDEARRKALEPPPPPAPSPRPATSQGNVAQLPDLRGVVISDADSTKAWARTYAMREVPVWLWHTACEVFAKACQRLSKRITPLEHTVGALEARVAGLEAKATKSVGHVRWAGPFEPGSEYHEGELTTGKGGLWLCTCATTTAAPGSSPTDWRLILRATSRDAE